jgi:circadian clock protein KaiB
VNNNVNHTEHRFVLRLYVAGTSAHSAAAETNLRRLLHHVPTDAYLLDVIDVVQRPDLAASARIVAIPTLVKDAPPPVRWIIGDLSDQATIAAELEIDVATLPAPGTTRF